MTLPTPTFGELGLIAPLAGAVFAMRVDRTAAARARALLAATVTLACFLAAWVEVAWLGGSAGSGVLPWLGYGGILMLGGVNAPILVLVALVSLVTMGATLRAKLRRFSFARTLVLESLLLLTLMTRDPWLLIALLGATALPVVFELRARGRSGRVLAVHTVTSVVLMGAGWAMVSGSVDPGGARFTAGFWLLVAGVGIRAGLLPGHCWVLDMYQHGALGTALLSTAPLVGAQAVLRLLLPGAPEEVLLALVWVALLTSVYGAAMSTVQTDAREFLCYMVLSQTGLVVAAMALPSTLALTAGLWLWLCVPLSITGLALTVRMVEARSGRLSLVAFRGLHAQVPTLAALFLAMGLASAGFPGTIGFFGAEMLMDAATVANRVMGMLVVATGALSGIAIMRAYCRIFLGARHHTTVDLRIRRVELATLLPLLILLIGGTLWPQPVASMRRETADSILEMRRAERISARSEQESNAPPPGHGAR